MPYHIALTGGIATGKSTVERLIAEHGIPVIDADKLTHELYAIDDEFRQQIADEFGAIVFINGDTTQAINRQALGQIAFNNPDKLKLLESWIHPKVIAAQQAFYAQHADAPFIVTSIPILFEKGRETDFHESWLVFSPRDIQQQRLVNNRHMQPEEATIRIDSQWPIDDKKALATEVIDNSSDLSATKKRVTELVSNTLAKLKNT
jgi:dephospho-CoA kinase